MLYNLSSSAEQRLVERVLEDKMFEGAPAAIERLLDKWDKHIEKLKSQLGVANARLEVGRMAKVEIPKLP